MSERERKKITLYISFCFLFRKFSDKAVVLVTTIATQQQQQQQIKIEQEY